MKFIKLESRGGNYLVVASNVAWLRTAENGQTSVGIVGGQPLLVVGSVEDVAEKILIGLAGFEADAAEPEPVPEPAATVRVAMSAPEPASPPQAAPGSRLPATAAVPPRPRDATARSASQWERPVAAPESPQIKSSSQRMMGMLE